MQVTRDEQRILRSLFNRPEGNSSREELKREFLSRLGGDVDNVLRELAGKGLIIDIGRRVFLTDRAWQISDRIPQTPLYSLVVS